MRIIQIGLLVAASAMAAAQFEAQSAPPANSPWQMQDSGTKAGLRGIYAVDGAIAWAGGTRGTVLRTTDGGSHWQKCTVPDVEADGVMLDFRGVQAWDAQTAIVLASGPGERSRLYKTTDGCINWDLLITNPDKEGFWDALRMTSRDSGVVIGDAVKGAFVLKHNSIQRQPTNFPLFATQDGGDNWRRIDDGLLYAKVDDTGNPTEAIFAGGNSALLNIGPNDETLFITGGVSSTLHHVRYPKGLVPITCKGPCAVESTTDSTLARGRTAGGFSLAANLDNPASPIVVAVGGDFTHPDASAGTAATCLFKVDGGGDYQCQASATPPHGYRSAVQWSESLKAFVAVGTNGSDISLDGGKTWQPLDNGNWNALSLPFVVGPNGRIAKLDPAAIPPHP
jgi:photosystem II stability/assembly factor-like uncharacterized protein